MYTQLSTQYAFISDRDHYNQFACILYLEKKKQNGTLLCDVTVMLIRQEKTGNLFFLFKKMNINHFYSKMHTAAQISTKRPALIDAHQDEDSLLVSTCD